MLFGVTQGSSGARDNQLTARRQKTIMPAMNNRLPEDLPAAQIQLAEAIDQPVSPFAQAVEAFRVQLESNFDFVDYFLQKPSPDTQRGAETTCIKAAEAFVDVLRVCSQETKDRSFGSEANQDVAHCLLDDMIEQVEARARPIVSGLASEETIEDSENEDLSVATNPPDSAICSETLRTQCNLAIKGYLTATNRNEQKQSEDGLQTAVQEILYRHFHNQRTASGVSVQARTTFQPDTIDKLKQFGSGAKIIALGAAALGGLVYVAFRGYKTKPGSTDTL